MPRRKTVVSDEQVIEPTTVLDGVEPETDAPVDEAVPVTIPDQTVTFVNLSKHPIRIYNADTPDRIAQFEADDPKYLKEIVQSTGFARIPFREVVESTVNGVPVVKPDYRRPMALPEPQDGKILIVSSVLACLAERPDVLAPARMVRNEIGQILGCKALSNSRLP